MVLYLKGGGARPTHNYAETCEDIGKLSRLVVLAYSLLGDTLLSPFTVSVPGGSAPDSASFLYLHQESLVTSMDALCPKAVESRMSVQPGLSMLTVNSRLVSMFRVLEERSADICRAVDAVFKDTRKRKKQTDVGDGIYAGGNDGVSAPKRSKQ